MCWSRRHNCDLPTYVVYQDIMEIFEAKGSSEHGKRLAAQYKEKILGKTALSHAPTRYWQISAVIEMGIDPEKSWATYSLNAKAEIMAQRYIKSMVRIIDDTYKELDEAQKRQDDQNKKNLEQGGAKPAKNDSGAT